MKFLTMIFPESNAWITRPFIMIVFSIFIGTLDIYSDHMRINHFIVDRLTCPQI